jgi:ubiquinone/menaquinone biosynthesis C-methylase UbiE
MVIPAPRLRFGGDCFKEDSDFAGSARREADRLVRHCGLTTASSVVEIGCGPGRLPIGIIDRVGEIRSYQALDVSRPSIEWCREHITRKHPSYRFDHIDVVNSRYNEGGTVALSTFQLPVGDRSADIIYLYSVFSHLKIEDIRAYLRDFSRILRPDGTLFLTAFVEANVRPETENPPDYGGGKWEGPLHCVLFETGFFGKVLEEHGFEIVRQEHGTETDGQSAFYIQHLAGKPA